MEVELKTKFLAFFIVLSVFIQVSAQEVEIKDKKPAKVDVSLNGGLSMKFSSLGSNGFFLSSDTEFAYLVGFKAAVVFNKSWFVGGAGYFLGNRIAHRCDQIYNTDYSDEPCYKNNWSGTVNEGHLSLGYGGLTAGYTFNIRHFFRVETGFLIGGGRFSNQNEYGDYYSPQSFFALEPEINLLFVITKFIATSINFSYRLISGMGQNSLYFTADMSGPTVGLDIRLGSF
jgi:hypothetical protein